MQKVWHLAVAFLLAGTGLAGAETIGAPTPWQLYLPEPVTVVAREVFRFHDIILVLVTAITLFVLGLVFVVAVKFRASVNPVPSRRTHNTMLEVIWTAIPVVILVIICIPALRLLYLQEVPPTPDLVIKATGNQWYWTYEYSDEQIEFDALMLTRDEVVDAGFTEDFWKLATDNAVVVPVDQNVLVQVTASDVIHAWAMPNFASKVDAVPGRLNQTWFRADTTGTFFGQCSELCGRNHAYMPIMVRVVTQPEYQRWLRQARDEFASRDAGDVAVALGN